QVPEPEPSALGHRALRAKLAAATDAVRLKGVIQEIEDFFPGASADREAGQVNLARWEKLYSDNPAEAYRTAPAHVRKGLDRRLWADANEKLLELQVFRDIPTALGLAERAQTTLPERKGLADRVLEKAISQARKDLSALRQSEVKELAGVLRDKLGQPAD